MMTDQEILCSMALSRVGGLSAMQRLLMVRELGSASAVYEHRRELAALLPEASPRLAEVIDEMESWMPRAHEELEFAQRQRVQCICYHDERYPVRLRECDDAPVILYYYGNANLNARRVVSIVGTRRITDHGRDVCRRMVEQLAQCCPGLVVVSGLAYGVDVQAHRTALDCGLPTVGILAHGLDRIYPSMHREVASRMVSGGGGLLTEYMSRSHMDKWNFVQRNRIVAGICDAVIVVESAAKGGSLITAGLAGGYQREVFAVPGRPTDAFSEGCNELIRQNKAQLITRTEDLVCAMGWDKDALMHRQLAQGLQLEAFPTLSPQEQTLVDTLKRDDYKPIDQIAREAGMTVGEATGLLLALELTGVVRMKGGSSFRLA